MPKDEDGRPDAQSKTDSKQDQQIESLKDEIRRGERWIIGLTAAIALFALGSVAAALLQWSVMRSQLAEMHTTGDDTHTLATKAGEQATETKTLAEQTRSLAESARTSADAAKASADNSARLAQSSEQGVGQARESLRLDQRAWIALDTIEGKPIKGENWKIALSFKNVGKTPATKVVGVTVCDPVQHAGGPSFDYRNFPHPAVGFLAPNGIFSLTLMVPITSISTGKTKPIDDELLRLMETHAVTVYIHGHITYEDIFRRPHWLDFCHFYSPTIGGYGACEQHNESDSERPQSAAP